MLDIFNNADFPFLADVEVIYFSTRYDTDLGVRVLNQIIGSNSFKVQNNEEFVCLGNGFYGLANFSWATGLDTNTIVAIDVNVAISMLDVLKAGEQLISIPLDAVYISKMEEIALIEKTDDLSALKEESLMYISNAMLAGVYPQLRHMLNVLTLKMYKHIVSGTVKISFDKFMEDSTNANIKAFVDGLKKSNASVIEEFSEFVNTCGSLVLVDIEFESLQDDEIQQMSVLLKESLEFKRFVLNVLFDMNVISTASDKDVVYAATRSAIEKIRSFSPKFSA